MTLSESHSADEKRRWKIVRTDYGGPNGGDVDCDEIISADEDSGECQVKIKGETQTLSFGPRGIRIVGRAR